MTNHESDTGGKIKYYGFWRSLATGRIALAMKGVKAEEISVNLVQKQPGAPNEIRH
jgi:hypothetical protein